jgi:hypothetical protein
MKVFALALALSSIPAAVFGEEAAQNKEAAPVKEAEQNIICGIFPFPPCPKPSPSLVPACPKPAPCVVPTCPKPPVCPIPEIACPIVDCPAIDCPVIDCPPFDFPAFNCIQAPCPIPGCAPCPIVDCIGPLPLEVSSVLNFVRDTPKINIDYTPSWGRGRPSTYIDNVSFPRVLTDKLYRYRILSGERDLGVRSANTVAADGSQRVNFLEWNKGYGIRDTITIKVLAVDPLGSEYLVAQWN